MRVSATARSAVVHAPTTLQVESWRLLWDELARDAQAAGELREWAGRRQRALPHARELLGRFVAGEIGLDTFRGAFDRASKGDWSAFGAGGASGAMFLNELVKRFDAEPALEAALRRALRLPADEAEALARLGGFVAALDALADRASLPGLARRPSPTRAAFLVSAWWSVAGGDRWPAFHPSARQALQREEGLYVADADAARGYLAFRETFLTLAGAMNVAAWELEYLCWWHERDPRALGDDVRYAAPPAPRRVRETARLPRPAPADAEPGDEPLSHTHVQWLLATLGARLGCRVWVAANDRRRRWRGEPLGALSVPRLPSLGMDAASQRLVGLIDVVWLKGANQVAAAFEVERTTSVYSGLLRMADLAALAPNLNFPLYVVAPDARLEKVRRELLRPAFRALDLPRRCAYFSGEALLAAYDGIVEWGSGPAAIERLAHRAEPDAD